VPILLLKLTLTPLIVGGASLASRRWGPTIGGWIVSLPLTSGPILFFLALDHGASFAADATTGTLLGLGAICGFCIGWLAGSRWGPAPAFAAASVAYAAVSLAVQPVTAAPFPLLAIVVAGAIGAVLRILPPPSARQVAQDHPRWDLPARVIVGTTFVVAITQLAPLVGPITSGLVSTFPVYVSVLAIFEHLRNGRAGGLGVLLGLLTGLFGTVAFYVVVWALVEPAGVAVAFPAAIAVTGVIGMASLRVVRGRAPLHDTGPETA
jgi:hypothetical protein